MGDMAGFHDEKLPPFHRQATGIPSRKLRPDAGSCEQGRMFSEGRVLVTKVSQLGWHVISALAADRYAHDEPWRVAGAALAVGALVGFLLARR